MGLVTFFLWVATGFFLFLIIIHDLNNASFEVVSVIAVTQDSI